MLTATERGGIKVGRGSYESKAVSVDDRPYGRCYGQVCGVAYPCTQQEAEKVKAAIPSRSDYARSKRGSGGGMRVTCVETGEQWPSMKAAAASIGIGEKAFRRAYRSKGGEIRGRHYKVAR